MILLMVTRLKFSCSVVTPWTVTHQAPLSMRFSRQGYWSGLPFLSPMVTNQQLKSLKSWILVNIIKNCLQNSFHARVRKILSSKEFRSVK